jgi:hypothetical protein
MVVIVASPFFYRHDAGKNIKSRHGMGRDLMKIQRRWMFAPPLMKATLSIYV